MQIRNILVPLDGSALAEHALPVAATLAARTDACLRLLAVVPGAGFLDPSDLPAFVADSQREAIERLGIYLDGLASRLRRLRYLRTTTEVVIDAPVEGILHAVETHHVDFVVMTSHGRGGIQRAWLGSVADALVRRTDVPIMILKPEETGEADLNAHASFDSVLVPLDGSAVAEAALEPAVALADAHGATLTLLQVVNPPYEVMPGPVAYGMNVDHVELTRRREAADAYLHDAAERVRKTGLEATPVVVVENSAPEAIVDYARNGAGAVIALATHGVGGAKRLLLGSVADKVLRGADRPVLVVRPETSEVRPAEQPAAEPAASAR